MTLTKRILTGGLIAGLMAGTAYASVIDRPFFKVLGVVVVWGGTDFDEASGSAPVVSDFVLLTNASGTAGADLIGGDDVYSVVTGSLTPISDGTSDPVGDGTAIDPITGEISGGTFTDGGTVGLLDAADSLTAFGIDDSTTVGSGMSQTHNSSFYVASNAAFDIFAHAPAASLVKTGDFTSLTAENISFELAMTDAGDDGLAFGSNAGVEATIGTINPNGYTSLDDLSTESKVFDGTGRTAVSPGSLASQSVRFDATYELDSDTGTAGVQEYDLSMGSGTIQADVTYTIYVP